MWLNLGGAALSALHSTSEQILALHERNHTLHLFFGLKAVSSPGRAYARNSAC